MADKLKVSLAALLLIAGIVAFYYYSNQPLVARVGMVLAGIALGMAIGWTSEYGRQLNAFVRQAIEETRKVVWPTRKESFQTTGIVFVFVVVMAIFLWIVDKILGWALYDLILGWRR